MSEKRIARRQHCQALAVIAIGHYARTEYTKTDDPKWLREEITALADFLEEDLKRAEKGWRA